MANEVAKREDNTVAAYSSGVNLGDLLAEELDGLTPSFERIKIPAGGGLAYEVPGDDPDSPDSVKEFKAVILYHHPINCYYKEEYTGGNNPPDCGSMDGKIGIEAETGEVKTCAECEFNKFGSGKNGAKACKQKRRIYLLREGEALPTMLSLPTGSLGEFSKYVMRLLSKGRKTNGVVTKFTLKKAQNSGGINYSQAVFAVERVLTDAELESMFDKVKPTNPNRKYTQPSVAIAAIEALAAKGDISTITAENYEIWKGYCAEARAVYESLNFDLRSEVTNLNVLEKYEAAVKAARPKPKSTVVLNASSFTDVNTPITVEGHTFSFHSALVAQNSPGAAFTYNDVKYPAATKSIRLNGNGSVTGSSPTKYIEFNLTGACTVTIVAKGGKKSGTIDEEWRTIQMVNVNNSSKVVAAFDIPSGQDIVTNEISEGGTYRIASKGSNIDVYYIIIEYYA